jgi:hypothetical protein
MSKNRLAVALVATAVLLNACGPSAWEEARTADTIEALEAFVEQNPGSEHVGEAMARIESLWQTRWDEVSAANTRSKFVEFVRSGASGDHLAAARKAIMALQEQPLAAGGKIEMYGMYGPSGLIEDVDAIATRYEGVISGMPASVEYSIKAGTNADGEQQYFSFDWSAMVLTLDAPANVEGVVELKKEGGETVRYELFGLVPGPDRTAVGSYLVGRGPDLLWSNVEGMELASNADGEPQHVLEADEAVLFALNEHMSIEYVP